MKVKINLPKEQVDWLLALSQVEDLPVSHLISRAVHTEKFFLENKGKILVEKDNGDLKYVIR